MNLSEGWVGKKRASFVSAIRRCNVAAASVCRQIENVSVAPAGEHNCIRCVPFHFSGEQISSDYSFGMAIADHQIEHLCVRKHLHRARGDLPAKCLVTA